MATTISALSGVQWTDLNGVNLSATEKTATIAKVNSLNTTVSTTRAMVDEVYNQISPAQSFSIDDLFRWSLLQNSKIATSPVILTPAYVTYDALGNLLTTLKNTISSSITENTKFSMSQWSAMIEKMTQEAFIQSSKLSVADGGGLKTYGGNWYVNGQQISYLDITFAVRVNQLSVINETVTNHLSTLQKNNAKIKLANQISSIITNASPTSSSGTTNANELTIKILDACITAGVIDVNPWVVVDSTTSFATNVVNKLGNGEFMIYTSKLFSSAGEVKITGKTSTGTVVTQTYDKTKGLAQLSGITYLSNNTFDMTALKEMIPSSLSKFLNEWGIPSAKTATLNQTDCTTVTTELKSFTTNMDSNNQLLQTNLSQLNDKRTEVLDSMSNLIKGNTSVMNDMGRNLGSI